jgi:hypothetical protein
MERAEMAHPDKLIQQELIQQGVEDVLHGHGYTWNVPLNLAKAKKAVYGEAYETKTFRRNERNEPMDA